MSKKKSKAPGTTGAISPEEFEKLTPAEQLELLNTLAAENAEAKAAVEKLNADKPKGLPTIEVEEDKAAGIKGGEYQATSPSVTHDGVVYNVAELIEQAGSDDEAESLKASNVLAQLVVKGSLTPI